MKTLDPITADAMRAFYEAAQREVNSGRSEEEQTQALVALLVPIVAHELVRRTVLDMIGTGGIRWHTGADLVESSEEC